MKCDWEYVTKDKAKVNIATVAAEVINSLSDARDVNQIVGVCRFMNALLDSIGDDNDE